MLLCGAYAEAANVVSVVEAKSTLMEANNHAHVAFQLSQRVEQLQRSQALGCLLLWETHLWRFGTSSRFPYCICFSFDPVAPPSPKTVYAHAVSPSVWPADAACQLSCLINSMTLSHDN